MARSGRAIEHVHERVTSATLFVTMAALGDAIIGDDLRRMVGRERDAVRQIIAAFLPRIVEGRTDEVGAGTLSTKQP